VFRSPYPHQIKFCCPNASHQIEVQRTCALLGNGTRQEVSWSSGTSGGPLINDRRARGDFVSERIHGLRSYESVDRWAGHLRGADRRSKLIRWRLGGIRSDCSALRVPTGGRNDLSHCGANTEPTQMRLRMRREGATPSLRCGSLRGVGC
jgi:hypothetical protein